MFSIVGGKLTEYRYMAQDAVDRAVAARGLAAGPCRTHNLPLIGARHHPVRIDSRRSARVLLARFGAEAANVVAAATCARGPPTGRRRRRRGAGRIRVRGHP
jgi:glycerol-3-phosphate dehydrogenase